jgi:hypothetical protein
MLSADLPIHCLSTSPSPGPLPWAPSPSPNARRAPPNGAATEKTPPCRTVRVSGVQANSLHRTSSHHTFSDRVAGKSLPHRVVPLLPIHLHEFRSLRIVIDHDALDHPPSSLAMRQSAWRVDGCAWQSPPWERRKIESLHHCTYDLRA